MDGPSLRIERTGEVVELTEDVTTVGRGPGVHVSLPDASVSRLHAEIVRRGPYVYVADLGLSRNGTRVNGRLVGRKVLADGDVVRFGAAGVRVLDERPALVAEEPARLADQTLSPNGNGVRGEEPPGLTGLEGLAGTTAGMRIPDPPDLTRREWDVLRALCRPLTEPGVFVMPRSAREIARDLVVTEGAVKQHLLRLYRKFGIAPGPNRRGRLANEAVRLGVVRPMDDAMAPPG
ncbi:FHA domain-containing protein [Frankia sp. Mgl5]|uniref:FHA domain-containing protein n=1 Tax=Frankia sp. Mgl5 TaxID=2933793 RepID=UPI00200CC375|nr:FHA domain-containing protein [Frankia sp. Mgl5]MCK9926242.1 FHA domain-containing protein [Frankia sp. Mgl5]